MKLIYTSATEKEAELALESFDQKWSKQYPYIVYPPKTLQILIICNGIEF
ncbi:hypothetical protein [Rickettsia endosymbiont of Urophora cardui]